MAEYVYPRYITDGRYNKEEFRELYFSLPNEQKMRLLDDVGFFHVDEIKEFISENMAKDMLSIDTSLIKYVPEKYITQEDADRAFKDSIHLIEWIPMKFITKEMAKEAVFKRPYYVQYIPKEYIDEEYVDYLIKNGTDYLDLVPNKLLTLDVQKKMIDRNLRLIKYIRPEILTDEIIKYALDRGVRPLGMLPDERRTPDICMYAVSKHGKALHYVPKTIINRDICFKAVLNDPEAIIHVPIELLDEKFFKDITDAGIIIKMKDRDYVRECIRANKRLEVELMEPKVEEPKKVININTDYLNIDLRSISGIISNKTMELLDSYNITTVGLLIYEVDNGSLLSSIIDKQPNYYKELVGIVKLLKCKYLGIDPMVEFSEDNSIQNLCDEIGISVRSKHSLMRGRIADAKELYDIVTDETRRVELKVIRNMGETSLKEIYTKMGIVIDYYKNKEQRENDNLESDSVESLEQELLQLREEMNRINNRIDIVLAKIQEKRLGQTKGGVSK